MGRMDTNIGWWVWIWDKKGSRGEGCMVSMDLG